MSDQAGDPRSLLARVLEARVPGLEGEQGRAASTVQWFLVLSLGLSAGYTLVDAVYDASALAVVIVVNTACAVGYALGLVLVRTRHQLGAAVLALSLATVQVLWVTAVIGWEAGFHLYLLAGAQLVFLVFTERQRALRGVFLTVALVSFLYGQLALPPAGEDAAFTVAVRTAFFSINAVLVGLIMFTLAAVSYRRAWRAQQEAAANAERAEFLANTDALTGLANRRPVMEHLQELTVAATPYAVAIADLDHFKQLNDEHGHACGDRVLATLGGRLRSRVRATDSVGRWGGEEFVFVLADTALDDASALMERVREAVADPIPCIDHDHVITTSVGVADAVAGAVLHRVIKRADDALYDAKAGGRNQVCALAAGPGDALPPASEIVLDPAFRPDRGSRRADP